MNNANRNLFFWVLIAIALFGIFQILPGSSSRAPAPSIAFSDFLTNVTDGRVKEVVIRGNHISGKNKDEHTFTTYAPQDPTLIPKLIDKGVHVKAGPPEEEMPSLFHMFLSWLPIILLVAFWSFAVCSNIVIT